jgi:hypothetical protein
MAGINRIRKYKESISRFIWKEIGIMNQDPEIIESFKRYYPKREQYGTLIVITLINQGCDTVSSSPFHGYYASAAIDFIDIMRKHKHDITHFHIFLNCHVLPLIWKNLLLRNEDPNALNMRYEFLINEINKHTMLLMKPVDDIDFSIIDISDCEDIIRRFPMHQQKYTKLAKINASDIELHIVNKHGSFFELVFYIGWVVGHNWNMDIKDKVQELSILFTLYYGIGNDFMNLDMEMKKFDDVSYNYIINAGIQKSYERMIELKQKIVKSIMNMKWQSRTFQEILDAIQDKVDLQLEENIDIIISER